MKHAHPLLLALFALASSVTAQDDPPPAFDLWDDDWTNPSKSFDELIIDLDVLGLSIGGTEPWPRPDPAFDTPAAWREAVRTAPALSARDILASTEGLRVQVAWTGLARDLLGGKEVYRDIAEVLRKNGHPPDSDAVPTLDLVFDLRHALVKSTIDGKPAGSEPVAYLVAEAGLIVPARVLRSGEVHHARCTVAKETRLSVFAGEPTREDVARGLDEAISGLLEGIAGGAGAMPSGASVWNTWLADESLAVERKAAFESSFRTRDRDLEPGLEAIVGFRELRAQYRGRDDVPASFRLNDGRLTGGWAMRLAASGFSFGLDEGPALVNDVFLGKNSATKKTMYISACYSRVAVADDDCLALLDGRFARVAGETWIGRQLNGHVPDKFIARTRRTVDDVAGLFIRELGQGGLRGQLVADSNAELVARYLRTRKLVDVPEDTLFEIANRIAIALRPIPNDWIVGVDEQRQVYLPYVGDERSRSEHFERMIDLLVLADPMGMWAFDNIWNHSKGSHEYRPVLPDGFTERLEGRRPSGPGAIRGVWVLEPTEIVRRKTIFMDDMQRAIQISASFRELAPRLQGHRILFCEYIPANGNMNLTLSRYFWYQDQPEGWADMQEEFPPELNFQLIGPPVQGAPDYIEDAEYVVGQRR